MRRMSSFSEEYHSSNQCCTQDGWLGWDGSWDRVVHSPELLVYGTSQGLLAHELDSFWGLTSRFAVLTTTWWIQVPGICAVDGGSRCGGDGGVDSGGGIGSDGDGSGSSGGGAVVAVAEVAEVLVGAMVVTAVEIVMVGLRQYGPDGGGMAAVAVVGSAAVAVVVCGLRFAICGLWPAVAVYGCCSLNNERERTSSVFRVSLW